MAAPPSSARPVSYLALPLFLKNFCLLLAPRVGLAACAGPLARPAAP